MLRFKQLTTPGKSALSVSDAKVHLRVTDSASVATHANRTMGTGASQLLVIAKVAGVVGNQYAIRALVAGNNTPLSVSVSGLVITINCATNGGGSATSTVNDVIAKMYATPECAAIVDAQAPNGGTGVLAAATQANLTGGVDSGDEDAYIGLLIDAVTEILETMTQRAFIHRMVRAFFDDWPQHSGDCLSFIELPVAPLDAADPQVEVNYWNGTQYVTLDPSLYDIDGEDPDLLPRIVLKSGNVFPFANERANSIYVDYQAGYGDNDTSVPKRIKSAIMFLVAHFYMNREPVVTGTAVLANKIPYTFKYVMGSITIPSL